MTTSRADVRTKINISFQNGEGLFGNFGCLSAETETDDVPVVERLFFGVGRCIEELNIDIM